jgi:hypothetical protein
VASVVSVYWAKAGEAMARNNSAVSGQHFLIVYPSACQIVCIP